MRQRKVNADETNGHVSNGDIKKPKKSDVEKKTTEQLLVHLLFGLVGFIFASALFIFLSVDFYPEYERFPLQRRKTEVSEEHMSDFSKGETNQENVVKVGGPKHKEVKSSSGNDRNQTQTIGGWRLADRSITAKYDSGICNIERRSFLNLTTEEFERDYRYKKPLIVTFPNEAKDWTDPERWTVDNLKKEYGDFFLYSGNAREIVRRGGNGEIGSSFSDFVDKLITQEDGAGEPLYVFDRSFYNTSNLPKTLKPPEIFKIQNGIDDSIFFLGASKSGVSFHKHADSWNGVIYGRKRWFLYPINHTPPGGVFTGYTMLEWYSIIYPKLKAQADKPLECIQEAGEILYLPEGFYHGTINIGDTVAIGIQKKECEIDIQKQFYRERELFDHLSKSENVEERDSRLQAIIDLYTNILKELPDSTEVMNNLAELYTKAERQRASMEMLNRVLKKDPYFLMAMLAKVDLLKEINEVYKAEELLQEALALNPDLYDTRVKYGQLLYDVGRAEESVYHFKKACELRPTEISFWTYLRTAQILAGQDEDAQQTDEIIDYLQKYNEGYYEGA